MIRAIAGFLSGIPWWVWMLALLVGAFVGYGELRYDQGDRAGERAADARHRKTIDDLRAKTARQEAVAAAARAVYDSQASADAARHEQEKRDAYERGRAAAAGIAAGDIGVRTVWRDRECPQAAAGPGAEPAGRHPDVDPGRADAIGRVLGHGWRWDAAYGLAIARLNAAQQLLNACYDQPAR